MNSTNLDQETGLDHELAECEKNSLQRIAGGCVRIVRTSRRRNTESMRKKTNLDTITTYENDIDVVHEIHVLRIEIDEDDIHDQREAAENSDRVVLHGDVSLDGDCHGALIGVILAATIYISVHCRESRQRHL
jgi:hypothetical protein